MKNSCCLFSYLYGLTITSLFFNIVKPFDKEQYVFEKPVEKYLNKRAFITLLKGKSLKWST